MWALCFPKSRFGSPSISAICFSSITLSKEEVMKKSGVVLAVLALLATSAQAEVRSIEITIFGMD